MPRHEVHGEVVALADRQYGVVARAQLLERGFSSTRVGGWASSGRLRRMYPGVFAVGHAVLVPNGRRLAAVLACGPGAGLSFVDGGALWAFCHSRGTRFHVTVPPGGARGGRRPGIHVHVCRLAPEELTIHEGIPVTSVARTLLDHAAMSTDDQVAEAVDATITLGLYDQAAIDAVVRQGRAGSARLQRIIAARHPDSHDSRSNWERDMLRLLHAHGLRRPEVNAWLPEAACTADLLWRPERLVVEWDSWTFHSSPERFEADRAKNTALQLLGYTVLRFTRRQTKEKPEQVVAALRRFLS